MSTLNKGEPGDTKVPRILARMITILRILMNKCMHRKGDRGESDGRNQAVENVFQRERVRSGAALKKEENQEVSS